MGKAVWDQQPELARVCSEGDADCPASLSQICALQPELCLWQGLFQPRQTWKARAGSAEVFVTLLLGQDCSSPGSEGLHLLMPHPRTWFGQV